MTLNKAVCGLVVTCLFAALAFPVLAEDSPSASLSSPAPMPPRQMLLEQQMDIATKANVKVYKVNFPKGFKTPEHGHEGAGPRYVLKGRIKVTENGQAQEYGPGQVFWESGQMMTAENISDGEAEMLVFEVISPQAAAPASASPTSTPASSMPTTLEPKK